MHEDWDLLKTFFPPDWQSLASQTGALKGLRKFKSPDSLLRVLMMHVGSGYSLRETVVRAREAGLADLSDVALMKRLRKSSEWLRLLCVRLYEERSIAVPAVGSEFRAFDATNVKEPGKTGSLWRIHYSLRLPSLACDYFKLTPTSGADNGESFLRFPVSSGDLILADGGYSKSRGVAHVHAAKGHVLVRIKSHSIVFFDSSDERFDVLSEVSSLTRTGQSKSWPVIVHYEDIRVPGRLCALRKTEEAIRQAQEKLRKRAIRKGNKLKPQTLEHAKYVILFTTFPETVFDVDEVLACYRLRWQVELTFKRFKSLAQLGHLPKHDDESSQAWLYGKLFMSLLVEKLMHHASAISPWGYDLRKFKATESMA